VSEIASHDAEPQPPWLDEHPLDRARAAFRRWLYLPDTSAVDVTLATVAANRLDGDPVWVMLVSPPGGGKSELLNAVSQLEDAHPTGTLTEASLLSGTPKKERDAGARGGLLRLIGQHGIIVCKDFGSVLSMNRDARAAVLAALREIYDGAWTRHVGSGGGQTLAWSGKVGLIGGCTPVVDRHHGVLAALGERFAFYRLPAVNTDLQARQALAHAGREHVMRAELADAVRVCLADLAAPRERTDGETAQLISLATLVVRARSAVERDGYSREIELVPGAEAPTRLVIMLDRILAGLDAIGCDREDAIATVTKIALDSIPALRLACLRTLNSVGVADTNGVAEAVQHPASTTRRTLEDLTAHGLVACEKQGQGKAHIWALTPFAEERLDSVPETSKGAEESFNHRHALKKTNRESTQSSLEEALSEPASAVDEAYW
jgi:hypothetical protein